MYLNIDGYHLEFWFRARRCRTQWCRKKSGRFDLCGDCYMMKKTQEELDDLRREEERHNRHAR